MSKDTHGRTHRPAGLPKGVAGTYDRNPGTNGDDIAPPMPVHDDPDILRRELASIPSGTVRNTTGCAPGSPAPN